MWPPGDRFQTGREQAPFVETAGYILESLMLALGFIYGMLASRFGGVLRPLTILRSLPLALAGVRRTLMLGRGTFDIMSLSGVPGGLRRSCDDAG